LRDNTLNDFNYIISCLEANKVRNLFITNNFFPPIDISLLSKFVNLEKLFIGIYVPMDVGKEEAKKRFLKYQD
jgi:hypothetical protein